MRRKRFESIRERRSPAGTRYRGGQREDHLIDRVRPRIVRSALRPPRDSSVSCTSLTPTSWPAGAPTIRHSTLRSRSGVSSRPFADSIRRRPSLSWAGASPAPTCLDRSIVLTSTQYEPSYTLLKDIVAGLPCSAYVLVGNHDDRTALNR